MDMDAKAIASCLRRVARGKHGAQGLERHEAAAVFTALLDVLADPVQLGAFLIAQRMKGETVLELAGFVDAARSTVKGYGCFAAPHAAVDLPCYAGKRRAAPAYLAAALQARDRGIAVLVHGMAEIEGRLSARQVLREHGVRQVDSLQSASSVLAGEGIAYIDLADVCPSLHRLTGLRSRLGVRSFASSVARLLNPLGCEGQINGVFHTPYVARMAACNAELGQKRSLIFMGAEGEPELYAARQKLLCAQQEKALALLAFPDADGEPYPKQAGSLEGLKDDFAALLAGGGDAREHAVLLRMAEAFTFAASGFLPDVWEIKE